MSSSTVRTAFKGALTTNFSSQPLVDLTDQHSYLSDILDAASVTSSTPWLGINFQAGGEEPITVNATNDHGKYRETGLAHIHVVDIAKLGASDTILSRAEAIRNYFRGRNMSGVIVLSVTPPSFDSGTTLDFEDGWVSASFMCEYQMDVNL